ncbi:phytoene/squalene synthase family protein [Roseibium aquae]|nr:phytoene/squalene synthase family protein [Roseibium aquae]
MTSDFDHAAESLRTQDWNRYMSVLFADKAHRPGLFALYAFNAEIARVRQMISDPLPGEVRLQWWRDLLNGVEHGEVAGNPNAAALQRTIATYRLPVGAFQDLIDARVFDLYDDPMPSLHDLEGYAGETTSAIFQIAGMILNGGKDPGTATVAGHAGVAYALTGLMRSLPYHASRRQVFLPSDLLARHGVRIETVFQGQTTPELKAALYEMRDHVRHHLKRVRENLDAITPRIAAAYLPLALVEPYLKKLEVPDHDPLKELAEVSKLRRQWLLWRASRKPVSRI